MTTKILKALAAGTIAALGSVAVAEAADTVTFPF